MGSYDEYKRGRDLAWETLIKCGISSLPVELDRVADTCGIKIISFKRAARLGLAQPEKLNGRVFVSEINGERTVFVNTDKDKGSVRFSMAKGIGICLLSDDLKKIGKTTEYEAGIFARDLLMPAVVLYGLKAFSSDDIASFCGVSQRAAEIRAQRLAELKDRKRFYSHPLEQKVWRLFKKFIEENALKE